MGELSNLLLLNVNHVGQEGLQVPPPWHSREYKSNYPFPRPPSLLVSINPWSHNRVTFFVNDSSTSSPHPSLLGWQILIASIWSQSDTIVTHLKAATPSHSCWVEVAGNIPIMCQLRPCNGTPTSTSGRPSVPFPLLLRLLPVNEQRFICWTGGKSFHTLSQWLPFLFSQGTLVKWKSSL